jgi:predicted ArsR family transcriptional regulator
MQMRNIVFLLPLAACGAANSSPSDKIDAPHCSIAFETYATIAQIGGEENLSKGLHARQLWYLEQVRKLPPAERSSERINQLAKESVARGEKELETLKTCMQQQDSDPAYRDWLAR